MTTSSNVWHSAVVLFVLWLLMVNSKTFNLRVSLLSWSLKSKQQRKHSALTVLALADLLAPLTVSLPGASLVTSLSSPARGTRARACHRVTRGAVMTRTRVATARAPAAWGTGHGAAPASVAVMTRARVRGHTRAVLAARPGNIFNWIKIYYSDPKLNHESAELPSHKFKTPHRAANIITLQM